MLPENPANKPTEAYTGQFSPWQPNNVVIKGDSGKEHSLPCSQMYYSALVTGSQGDWGNYKLMIDTTESALHTNGFLSILIESYKQGAQ